MGASLLGLPAGVREQSSPSARLAWLTLREADGEMSATALAAETGVSPDQLRRVLQSLQQAGLVESREHPDDRRRTVWAIDRPDVEDTPAASRGHQSEKRSLRTRRVRNRGSHFKKTPEDGR